MKVIRESFLPRMIPNLLPYTRNLYISRLSMEPGFSQMKVIQKILHFCALLHGYVRRIFAANLSEIDKASYQIVYHSQGNPSLGPPCGKSWESVLL